jgi:hypothetical protein
MAKITHVAIRFGWKVYSLPAPNRHQHVRLLIMQETAATDSDLYVPDDDNGFLDDTGTYLTRGRALISARINNQLLPGTTIRYNQLVSENVW